MIEPIFSAFIHKVHRDRDLDAASASRACQALRQVLEDWTTQVQLTPFEVRDRESVVYYLRRNDGSIKIGYTIDLPGRSRSIAKEHGPLDLLAWEPGGFAVEQARHSTFAALRISRQGEWFRPGAPLLAHIALLAMQIRATNVA